jgi:hypothetical protein
MPALYISDLDGTLFRNDARLSAHSRNTLRELLADGVPFSVASARSVTSIRPLLRGLQLELPVIALNGAFLSDLETGRHEVVIDPAVPEDLYRAILKFECIPLLATFDGAAERLYHREAASASASRSRSSRSPARGCRRARGGSGQASRDSGHRLERDSVVEYICAHWRNGKAQLESARETRGR